MRQHKRTCVIFIGWTLVAWTAMILPVCAETLFLAQAVELGLKNHPRVQFAEGELKSLRGSFWEQLSPSDPVFRVENEEVPRGAGLTRYGLQTVGVSQSVDFPLITYFRARAMRESGKAAAFTLQSVRAEIKAEITMSYVGTWLAEQRVLIADSLAHAASALAEAARRRYAAGDATPVERDRLRAQAEQFISQRETAALELILARERLSRLTGYGPAQDFDVADPGLPEPLRSDSAAASTSALLLRARSSLKAAQARHTASRLSWLPQIEVELFRQRDRDRRYWGGAVGLSIPIWYPFRGRGAVLQMSGAVRQAAAELEETRRRWDLDWIEATRSYEIALRRLRSLEEIGLPASRSAYRASRRAYEVGELGVTDLLATFLETRTAEQQYLEVREEVWRRRVQVDVLSAAPSP